MKIIVCLDDYGGMLFNHRRQSRDRVLIADVMQDMGEEKICILPFTINRVRITLVIVRAIENFYLEKRRYLSF